MRGRQRMPLLSDGAPAAPARRPPVRQRPRKIGQYGRAGERRPGAPGIYVAPGALALGHEGAKIAALGLKIRNGCSYHGVSLNVKMDLRPFLAINPCGYAGLETVDMATLGVAAGWNEVAETLAARLAANLGGALRARSSTGSPND